MAAETARVQYVFLDVVAFTKNRSVEAQSDVVDTLNSVVSKSLQALNVRLEDAVLLPTGDGIAIALIEVLGVDIHLQLALHILRLVAEHDGATSDVSRRLEVRIGINENIDNVLTDINGRRNVAGAGISMAQRIMDKADGGQVLVGSTVHDTLRQRERYMSSFRAYTARGKHGVTFSVYQFVSKDAPGLNVSVPSIFVVKKLEAKKFTRYEAYYVAHAASNHEFLFSRKADSTRDYTACILLSFLAEDSEDAAETPTHEEATPHTWGAGAATFQEQYHHYDGLEFWILVRYSDLLVEFRLASLADHFQGPDWKKSTWLIKPSGIEKLISEWPQIANEFGITHDTAG